MKYVKVVKISDEPSTTGSLLKTAGLREGFTYEMREAYSLPTELWSLNGKWHIELGHEDFNALTLDFGVTQGQVDALTAGLEASRQRKAGMNAQVAEFWTKVFSTTLENGYTYDQAVNQADAAVADFLDRIRDGDFQV